MTAQASDDAMRPLHSLLRQRDIVSKLDFFYTHGGAIDVPWRVVNALRQYGTIWNILETEAALNGTR